MKIYDCITYFDEPMLFELRLNILNSYVDEFIVSEATFTHSGEKKKINFDKNKFPKFKNRITHLISKEEPKGLFEINDKNKHNNSLYRLNAAKRIEKQRDQIKTFLKNKNSQDWVIYSDSDEIPNLKNINLREIKNRVVLFNQNVFHYKFNLLLEDHNWFGSKACRIKDLKSISKLRYIKTKKYPWWRADVLFKDDKFINLKIIDNGGWHFTELKTPKEIYLKHKNDEHHDEFDLTGISERDYEDMVKNAYIAYDHSADKRDLGKKWNKNNRIYLSQINDNKLPDYLIKNKNKYINWFY